MVRKVWVLMAVVSLFAWAGYAEAVSASPMRSPVGLAKKFPRMHSVLVKIVKVVQVDPGPAAEETPLLPIPESGSKEPTPAEPTLADPVPAAPTLRRAVQQVFPEPLAEESMPQPLAPVTCVREVPPEVANALRQYTTAVCCMKRLEECRAELKATCALSDAELAALELLKEGCKKRAQDSLKTMRETVDGVK